MVYPIAQVIGFSFTSYSGIGKNVRFVGLDNFVRLFTEDPDTASAVVHTLVYGFFTVIVGTIISFLIAVLLDRPMRGVAFYRSAFFLPVVISPVAVAFTWEFILDPAHGSINEALRGLGLGFLAQDWLGNYDLALFTVIGVELWRSIGFSIVILLAGLSTIPAEINEASKIDGAGAWKHMFYITLPLLRPTLGLVVVLCINGAVRAFDTVYLLTGGGPGKQTELYMTRLFGLAFDGSRFGYASAMAVLIIVLLIGVAIAQMRLSNSTTRRLS